MKLGKVIGSVTATRKEGNLGGLKILVVSYLDENLADTKKTAACIDAMGAGEGDIVLLCSSSSARITQMTRNVASDNTIVGIVDAISSNNVYTYNKSKQQ
ncbi:MAG: EutN/CcmL family microcompartment protein [Ignavibacteriaceae bacterium]|nr:EutN/CcmL family microcompartment protein [Ignavibacteriaceae bacterium]